MKNKKSILYLTSVFIVVLAMLAVLIYYGIQLDKKISERQMVSQGNEIISAALAELGMEGMNAKLYFVSAESVDWLDYDCESYILVVDDRCFLVGVQRNGEDIHSIDVECELERIQ